MDGPLPQPPPIAVGQQQQQQQQHTPRAQVIPRLELPQVANAAASMAGEAMPIGPLTITAEGASIQVLQPGIKYPPRWNETDVLDRPTLTKVLQATLSLHGTDDEPTEHQLIIVRQPHQEGISPLVAMPVVCYQVLSFGYKDEITKEDFVKLEALDAHVKKASVRLQVNGTTKFSAGGCLVLEVSSSYTENMRRTRDAESSVRISQQQNGMHQQQQYQAAAPAAAVSMSQHAPPLQAQGVAPNGWVQAPPAQQQQYAPPGMILMPYQQQQQPEKKRKFLGVIPLPSWGSSAPAAAASAPTQQYYAQHQPPPHPQQQQQHQQQMMMPPQQQQQNGGVYYAQPGYGYGAPPQ